MTRRQKLKVFRTPAGFHDAYVAASSQKAALEAWGSDADLFARGIAEVVTDEELSREPLENPGKVIKRLRGTAAEQLASLPPDRTRQRRPRSGAEQGDDAQIVRRKRTASRSSGSRSTASSGRGERVSKQEEATRRPPKPQRKPKPRPRPSREKLDEAESALATIVERQERAERDLHERERALEKERRTMAAAHEKERRSAERAVEREREEHAERLDRWIERNG